MREDIVLQARARLAQCIVEIPPGSNAGPKVKEITSGAPDGEAWCGHFVFKVLADLRLHEEYGLTRDTAKWIPALKSWGGNKGFLHTQDDAEPGDIMIIKGVAHAGIVVENVGNYVITIEGNKDHCVRPVCRPKTMVDCLIRLNDPK